MTERLYASASPHLKSKTTTQSIMFDVIVSLMPALIASVVIFGIRSLIVTAVTVLSCVLSEYICRKLMKRDNTISDLSAVVTGLLLSFNLPVGINLWMAAFGGMVAIVVAKQMFGGIGQNFVNPALIGRIVLFVSFPTAMTTWAKPFTSTFTSVDSITTATPLALMKTGGELPSYLDMFLGIRGGCLGETCILALLIGGIYLLIRGVIKPIIPLCYMATVVILAVLLKQDPIIHLLSGGLVLGAVFMATDYTTSPLTNFGKVIFAVGCGLITMLIRVFGSYPEGVSFSIIIMNILVPHIEKFTRPVPFGKERISREKN